jgi:hypothetical protein
VLVGAEQVEIAWNVPGLYEEGASFLSTTDFFEYTLLSHMYEQH